MSSSVESLRAALEAQYGLALTALSEEQLVAAARDASARAPYDPWALARVVDCLPIEESWLFRDDDLWCWLRDDVGPLLLASAWQRGARLRVASLGCSNGPEPYSAALLLQGLLEGWGVPASGAAERVEVVGFDCSPRRIAQARSGELGSWAVERCGPSWPRARLHPLAAGRYRIDDAVRALCRFEVANLLELAGGPCLSGFGLVFCRHALIYFDPTRAAEVVRRLAAGLDPGTILILGAPEAHFLHGLPGVEPLPYLGAVRLSGTRAPARPLPPRARAPAPAFSPTPLPAPSAEGHLSAALSFSARGEDARALEEARAACFLRPDDLLARLVLGRMLSAVDADRGRAALQELLRRASALPSDASLGSAPELSAEQLADAIRLLLRREEER